LGKYKSVASSKKKVVLAALEGSTTHAEHS